MTKIEQLRAIPLAITPIDVLKLLDLVETQHDEIKRHKEFRDYPDTADVRLYKTLPAFEEWNKP